MNSDEARESRQNKDAIDAIKFIAELWGACFIAAIIIVALCSI
jgi:hypothetical protein